MDKEIFEKLFKTMYQKLLMLASRIVTNDEASQDIVQQAFLELYKYEREPIDTASAEKLLVKAVQHRAYAYIKRKNKLIERGKTRDIKLYFDLNDFSQNEILDTLSLLSAIYQSIGGDGLEISKMNTLEFEGSLIPA